MRKIQETALLEMLFSTGMRVSEVVLTDIGHVDIARRVISVHGKGNRNARSIPTVCDGSSPVHEKWHVQICLCPATLSQVLHQGIAESCLYNQSVRAMLRRHSATAGAPRITPPMLRHTEATLLLEEGWT